MSCNVDMQSVSKSYFTPEQKSFYNILFKDGYSAYVTERTLLDIIDCKLSSVDNIIKFNFDPDLELHIEVMLYSDIMQNSGDDYIKTYENLPEMYGRNPLTDFDRKIIRRLTK